MAGKITEEISKDLEVLIPGFMDNTYREIKDLETALKCDNLTDVLRIGHNIKGSALNYGFNQLAEIGRGIEISAADKRKRQVYTLLNELKCYAEQVEIIFV
ncbi:Hpt domain-containing protein [Maridesulfovibrio hydrothermalis]|uniref:Hpt protein n=1 Tax=Maridesulfovibrio hydrothermalis AM13 = DSM 14728 TaxID=1121451 RepID=L0REU1_9BACT|nr:Hpt domain-containing protein [Maridesulfovibrio hydrothermalis]CCO24715.1 Hpt protein [Maridesulfovibrio hydrothermalis AM13 = DSM 14728]